jgi:hypothetical protein
MATSLQDTQVHYPSIIRTNAQHPQPPPFPYRKLSHTTETTGINKQPINLTDCGILQSQLSESFFVKTISKIFPLLSPSLNPRHVLYISNHPPHRDHAPITTPTHSNPKSRYELSNLHLRFSNLRCNPHRRVNDSEMTLSEPSEQAGPGRLVNEPNILIRSSRSGTKKMAKEKQGEEDGKLVGTFGVVDGYF